MTTPEHLLRELLAHLGIIHVLHTHQGPNGRAVREHHLFVDGPLTPDVLRWHVRSAETDVVRIFEGDPPPF